MVLAGAWNMETIGVVWYALILKKIPVKETRDLDCNYTFLNSGLTGIVVIHVLLGISQ